MCTLLPGWRLPRPRLQWVLQPVVGGQLAGKVRIGNWKEKYEYTFFLIVFKGD